MRRTRTRWSPRLEHGFDEHGTAGPVTLDPAPGDDAPGRTASRGGLVRSTRREPLSEASNTLSNMLTHADIRLLEFEDTHPRRTGLKNDAILHRLGMSPARYYQRLDQLARQQVVQDRYPRLAERIGRRSDRRRQERAQLQRWL